MYKEAGMGRVVLALMKGTYNTTWNQERGLLASLGGKS